MCGAYSYEVAETKVATVQDLARRGRLSAAGDARRGVTTQPMFSAALELISERRLPRSGGTATYASDPRTPAVRAGARPRR